MGVRLPRLEALLGVRSVPGDLDAGVLARLVEAAITEDADLDFKRAPWPSGLAGAIALATDVAAFANTAGGLLLVGVEEEQTVATGLGSAHWDRYPGATADDVLVGPLTVEQQILAAVSLLAGHALRVHAGGDVLLAAQIVLPQAEGPTARGMVAIETEPHTRLLGGADRITGTTPALTAVPVADMARGPGQVAAAAVLAGELLSDFGVAGTTGVHDDGTVTVLPSLRGLAAWAGQHGVTARQ